MMEKVSRFVKKKISASRAAVDGLNGFRYNPRDLKNIPGTKKLFSLPALWVLLLLTLALASPPPGQAKGLGTWVWSASSFATESDRQELVRFCLDHGITHVDVHCDIAWQGGTPVVQNPESLRDLFLLAGRNRITTAIVRGEPGMFFLSHHEKSLKELRAMIDFSRTLFPGSLFKGFKYDVEPYLDREWKAGGPARRWVMWDYLSFLRRARCVMRKQAPDLLLAADTPFWWDREEFILPFEGETKRFSEHVQDLTDYIVIMSYSRNLEKVLASVEGERLYAERIHKVVHPSLETIQLKKDPQISFFGVPAEEFWEAVRQLQDKTKASPSLGGVRLHCYRGLKDKIRKRNLEPPGPISKKR